MRKTRLTITLMACIFLFTACKSKKNDSYDDILEDAKQETKSITEITNEEHELSDLDLCNLKFDDASLIIPEGVENIPVLKCEYYNDSPEQLEETVLEIAKQFSPEQEIDKDKLMYVYGSYDGKEYKNVETKYYETPDDIKKKREYLRYHDGTTCVLLYRTSYMMELTHSRYVAECLDEKEDLNFGTRALYAGNCAKTYNILEDGIPDVSYELEGGQVSLEEAVKLAEEFYDGKIPFVGSPYLENKVSTIDVYKLENGRYYYQIFMATYYNNVIFNTEEGVYYVREDGNSRPFVDKHKLSIIRKGTVDYIWSCAHNYEGVVEDNSVTEFITPEYACRLLSSQISEEQIFNVDEIEIVYQTDFCYGKENEEDVSEIQYVRCHPVYRFIVNSPQLSGYNKLYFFVDAITGQVSCNYD